VITHPSALGAPSKTMTFRTVRRSFLRSDSFRTCSSFSAKTNTAPESLTMYAQSSAVLEG